MKTREVQGTLEINFERCTSELASVDTDPWMLAGTDETTVRCNKPAEHTDPHQSGNVAWPRDY